MDNTETVFRALGEGFVKRADWLAWTHRIAPWTTGYEKRLIADANKDIQAANGRSTAYNMAVPGAVGAILGAMLAPRDKEGRKKWREAALLSGLGSAALGGIAGHYGFGIRGNEPLLEDDYGAYKYWRDKRNSENS